MCEIRIMNFVVYVIIVCWNYLMYYESIIDFILMDRVKKYIQLIYKGRKKIFKRKEVKNDRCVIRER